MFECDKCGECCRGIAGNPLYADLDRGDGVCKYLEDNLCSIHDNRPTLCNVDLSYDMFFKNQMTKEEFYQRNMKICLILKNK